MELRAGLIAKEKDVKRRMQVTLDPVELRRLWYYWRDLFDAVHGWKNG
jgi:hypothetical protein